MILSLVLLNLAGGDCVEDMEKLEADDGFCRILRKVEEQGLTRKERHGLKNRWRKGRRRTLPLASALFRYLGNFHNAEEEKLREKGKAFIPAANDYLESLARINGELIGFGAETEELATLDMDATITTTFKKNALYSRGIHHISRSIPTGMKEDRCYTRSFGTATYLPAMNSLAY